MVMLPVLALLPLASFLRVHLAVGVVGDGDDDVVVVVVGVVGRLVVEVGA